MKTNKETIKTYLEQEKTHGNSSNVFFEYSRIYSYGYHYILGRFLNNNLLIINDSGYSATTSKHIHLLRDTANVLNIKNYSVSSVEINSVYSELKYLETKLHKARKPELWYNRINSLYNNWFKFTKKYGALIMYKEKQYSKDLTLSLIDKTGDKAKDIQKIMLRVEQYYTALTLNMSL
jgi:hypothetical protein